MAEVVTVPIVGKVKQSWLYVGGALVAGVVGYAWWTRASVVEDTTVGVELPATEYEPPTVVDSGISVGGASQGEPIARTNVEWRSMAQEQGEALGFERTTMQSAISKFLGKGQLSAVEAAAISAVVAILGQPPTGGPYPISLAPVTPPSTTPTPTAPGAVTGLRYAGRQGPNHSRIDWAATPGATGYIVQYKGPGGDGPPWPEVGTHHDAYLAAGVTYDYDVWAVNATGQGPKSRIRFHA